ncbi:hypothetical protein QUA54_27710 [Microcoleus sp. MOSTC5]|uniref:hypothetical protein n=1 Tax=Microcoleus sp. MOSTC5 TaxID=3055378 RepID=UPI002FD1B1A3
MPISLITPALIVGFCVAFVGCSMLAKIEPLAFRAWVGAMLQSLIEAVLTMAIASKL